MMCKGSVPINHKKDDQCQCQVHCKKNPSAQAVTDQFFPHFLTGFMFSGISRQKEAHYGKTDIISRKGIKPKGVMPKAHAELQQCVSCIVDKSSVKRNVHSESCVVLPDSCILVLILKCFKVSN